MPDCVAGYGVMRRGPVEELSRGAVGRAAGRDVFENINLANRDQTGKQRKQAEAGAGVRLEGRTRAART